MGKGKSNDGGDDVRQDWKEPNEVKAFCDFCAVQVLEGKRKGGYLRKEGVDEVIKQLVEMGKVVTHQQFKNKWDHLRRNWRKYKDCFEHESGLGIDAGTGQLDATDDWWTRKIAVSSLHMSLRSLPLPTIIFCSNYWLSTCRHVPSQEPLEKKRMPNLDSIDIMYGGTIAKGKHAFCTSGPMPKESTEGSEDSVDSEEFVDPQCQSSVNVDPMEVEDPSLSRAGMAIDKGKSKLSSVHIARGICKKPKKKRSVVQELFDSLKSISNVIVESRTVSTRPPIANTATTEFKEILDMVLSLPGVQLGDRLFMFSTLFFMETAVNRSMFTALVHDKDIQLKWLEMQFQRNPQFHFL
ncbi:uncharacterized protein LOC142620697 [Castanea sativa]|uniref:uncharacterized protein LOC142620697 n=1 Tax=Castanea sativa TaxID=21020 RepID=UPI003F64B983